MRLLKIPAYKKLPVNPIRHAGPLYSMQGRSVKRGDFIPIREGLNTNINPHNAYRQRTGRVLLAVRNDEGAPAMIDRTHRGNVLLQRGGGLDVRHAEYYTHPDSQVRGLATAEYIAPGEQATGEQVNGNTFQHIAHQGNDELLEGMIDSNKEMNEGLNSIFPEDGVGIPDIGNDMLDHVSQTSIHMDEAASDQTHQLADKTDLSAPSPDMQPPEQTQRQIPVIPLQQEQQISDNNATEIDSGLANVWSMDYISPPTESEQITPETLDVEVLQSAQANSGDTPSFSEIDPGVANALSSNAIALSRPIEETHEDVGPTIDPGIANALSVDSLQTTSDPEMDAAMTDAITSRPPEPTYEPASQESTVDPEMANALSIGSMQQTEMPDTPDAEPSAGGMDSGISDALSADNFIAPKDTDDTASPEEMDSGMANALNVESMKGMTMDAETEAATLESATDKAIEASKDISDQATVEVQIDTDKDGKPDQTATVPDDTTIRTTDVTTVGVDTDGDGDVDTTIKTPEGSEVTTDEKPDGSLGLAINTDGDKEPEAEIAIKDGTVTADAKGRWRNRLFG